jgi:kynurenine formamidase
VDVRVRRVVDLSVRLDSATQVYPGDPQVRTRPLATVAADGCNLLHIAMGSQTGTHLDAPFHFRDDGARVDALDLSALVGPAVVVDVRRAGPRRRIGWEEFRPHAAQLAARRILVVHTGWSRHYGSPAYFDHPFLDAGAARRLLGLGVRAFLLDAPSIDETPDAEHSGEGFPVHHLIAAAGATIGENLTNLAAIDFDPFLVCLPLRLTGADGAPVRAVALDLAPGTAGPRAGPR